MGGERETTLEKKGGEDRGESTTGFVAGSAGRIRLHQNLGEVHFHDDTAQLKAAVPVAEWWKAWEKLKSQSSRWEWVDTVHNTYLVIETQVTGEPSGIEASITLSKAVFGTNFRELNNFTKRK